MKTLYLIGGPVAVGKTTVGKALANKLDNSIYLEGDDLAESSLLLNMDETKQPSFKVAIDQINRALMESYHHVIFTSVMDNQEVMNSIISGIKEKHVKIINISLVASPKVLRQRFKNQVNLGLRKDPHLLKSSLATLPAYQRLSSVKINTTDTPIEHILELILEDGCNCAKRGF